MCELIPTSWILLAFFFTCVVLSEIPGKTRSFNRFHREECSYLWRFLSSFPLFLQISLNFSEKTLKNPQFFCFNIKCILEKFPSKSGVIFTFKKYNYIKCLIKCWMLNVQNNRNFFLGFLTEKVNMITLRLSDSFYFVTLNFSHIEATWIISIKPVCTPPPDHLQRI